MDFIIFLLIVLGIIVLIMLLQYINYRKSDKLYLLKLNKNFGNNNRSSYDNDRLLTATKYFDLNKSFGQIDDITYSDLDMEELFKLMDNTQSDFGCMMLYHILRSPVFDTQVINDRQDEISFWINNPTLRNRILLALHHIGRVRKLDIYGNIDKLADSEEMNILKYVALFVLLMTSIVSMYFFGGFGVLFFVVVLTFNMSFYYREKNRIAVHYKTFEHILKLIDYADDINNSFKGEDVPEEYASIKTDVEALASFKRKNGVLGNMGGAGNQMAIAFELIGALFFADLIRFYRMKKELVEHRDVTKNLIVKIGTLDAMISVAGFVYGRKEICKATISKSCENTMISGLVHPLLDNPVANDIDIDNSILITGSNASGKSTFIKAVALSYIMAETIGYVCAKSYETGFKTVMTSMSVKDNISQGDSYYMAEIKAVNRIIEGIDSSKEKGLELICFVDELLKGTNTTERIAASTQILKTLADKKVICLAATHDIELTQLLLQYDNYHFEEDLTKDGDVRFSYLITEGPAKSRNAIKLLSYIGYDKNITDAAERMVNIYEESGVWTID